MIPSVMKTFWVDEVGDYMYMYILLHYLGHDGRFC